MGYMGNQIASSLRSGRTHTLAVILGNMSNPFYGIMADTIQDAAAARGYSLLIMCSRDQAEPERRMVEAAVARRADGILLFPTAQSLGTIERLRAIGVPVNLSGYQQLKTAIAFVVASGRRQIRVTNEVYVYVAEVHGTTPKRVERNIRTAIETAWQRGDIKSQHKLFGYTVHQMKGRPTNKEFIAMIADKTMLSLGRINS